jgi:hypothetical protein
MGAAWLDSDANAVAELATLQWCARLRWRTVQAEGFDGPVPATFSPGSSDVRSQDRARIRHLEAMDRGSTGSTGSTGETELRLSDDQGRTIAEDYIRDHPEDFEEEPDEDSIGERARTR